MITFIAAVLMLQIIVVGVSDFNTKGDRKKIDREVKRQKEFERQQRRIRRVRKK
jgi:hypothetical protein